MPKPSPQTSAPLAENVANERESRLRALESLQTRILDINGEIIAKIAGLKRLQNEQEALIHKFLPTELFIDILASSIDWPNWTLDQIHQLARVSKYWFNVIVNSPRFWPEIDVAQGKEITAMVLRRNPTGPLVVRCTTRVDELEQRLEFMKTAAQHHDRWKSLIFKGKVTEAIFPYLESPTPHLTELFIYQYSGGESQQKLLRLTDGIPLRHLDVDFVSMPWDSPRLVGLQSLQIRNLAGRLPRLSQLHIILKACPDLRWLLLAKLSERPPDDPEAPPEGRTITVENAAAPEEDSPPVKDIPPSEPIPLPFLTTLVLQGVPRPTSHHLLSHIEASGIRCLMADDAHLDHLRESGSSFFNLLKPSISTAKDIEMTYEEATGHFRVTSLPLPEVSNEWIHWVKQTVGIDLSIRTEKRPEFWEDLTSFQSAMASTATAGLHLVGEGTEPDASATPSEPTPTFPDHALGHLPQITRIKCSRHYPASAILRYLGRINSDASAALAWSCPNLTTLELSRWKGDVDAMVEDILAFARVRYSGSEGGQRNEDSDGVKPPVPLEKLLVPESILERLGSEDALHGITLEAS